jgi:hypothetical protein
MRVYVAVVLAALMLASCGLPPTVFRSDRNSELLTAPPLQETAIGGIFIAPVENANADSLAFRRRLARALVQQDVAAGIDVAGAYSAKLLSAAAPANFDGKGYVDVWWRLEGPDGAIWDAFSIPTPLDFRVERGETIAVINAITARVVDILGPVEPPPQQAMAPLVVAIPPAKTQGFEDGGPLSRAMAAQLAARGMQPGEADAANAVIHVRAAIEPVKAGGQETVQIQIRWTVVDKAGLVLGTVNQKNQAPLAAIDAGLTTMAPDAAGAAADAVADLVRKARPAVTAQQSTGQVKQ